MAKEIYPSSTGGSDNYDKKENKMIVTAGRLSKDISAILLMLFFAQVASGQYDSIATQKPDKRYRVRNIVWYTPGGAKEINGLAVGIQATNFHEKKFLKINGLNIDAGLVSIMAWPQALVRSVGSGSKGLDESIMTEPAETTINGISISFGGELSAGINGLSVNGLVISSSYINGVCASGFVTACGRFRGIMITGFSNVAIEGRGLQVGLFNRCKRLKGLQIGLWNKSGKRGLPLINWGV